MHSKRIREKVKEDYDSIAQEFSDSRRFPWKDFEAFRPFYKKNSTVLDLGCGNGRLLHFLKDMGYKHYLGVDQSEALISLARSQFPKEEFLVADMSQLPDLKREFDAVFLIASFHHLPPDRQLSTLKRVKTLLKPGGHVFMTNWNLLQPRYWSLWLRMLIRPTYGLGGLLVPWQRQVNRYYYGFTKNRLAVLFRKAGYKILKHEFVKHGKSANLFRGQNILSVLKK